MKLYLDTEFNGHGGALISMALTTAKPLAHEWYGWYVPWFEVTPWVADNVLPHLKRHRPVPFEGPVSMRLSFFQFIKKFHNPEIVCDWHADLVHFCNMLCGPTYEASLDYPFCATVLKTPPGGVGSLVPHNALEDARALARWDRDRLC